MLTGRIARFVNRHVRPPVGRRFRDTTITNFAAPPAASPAPLQQPVDSAGPVPSALVGLAAFQRGRGCFSDLHGEAK